jgi:hypothetical protein
VPGTKTLAVNFYNAHPWDKSVVGSIYPMNRNAQYGYLELVYRWDLAQKGAPK